MTATAACELVVDLLRDIVAVTQERDGYRGLARAAIHYCHELAGENSRLRDRNRELLDQWREARGFSSGVAREDRDDCERDEARAA